MQVARLATRLPCPAGLSLPCSRLGWSGRCSLCQSSARIRAYIDEDDYEHDPGYDSDDYFELQPRAVKASAAVDRPAEPSPNSEAAHIGSPGWAAAEHVTAATTAAEGEPQLVTATTQKREVGAAVVLFAKNEC